MVTGNPAKRSRLECGAHRDLGLAVADIAAQKAVHRRRQFHVAFDVGDCRRLIGRQLVGESALELFLPVSVGGKCMARHRAPLRVELEQLFRHVAHRLLDARLGFLPGGAAQPIERRPRTSRVLLHQVEPLDGDEQLVLAGVAKLQELLRAAARSGNRAADRPELFQADEFADAVVDVDDQIADLEVAQIGQEGLGEIAPLLGRTALLLEHVGLGVDLQRTVGKPEAA